MLRTGEPSDEIVTVALDGEPPPDTVTAAQR